MLAAKKWRRWREFKFYTPFPLAHLWKGVHFEVESTQLSQSPLCNARGRVAFFIERVLSDPERRAISAAVYPNEHTMLLLICFSG